MAALQHKQATTASTPSEQPIDSPVREAVISIDRSELKTRPLGRVLALVRDAGVVQLEVLDSSVDETIIEVTVSKSLNCDRFDHIESVTHVDHLSSTETGHVYLLSVESMELLHEISEQSDLIGGIQPTISKSGVQMTLVGSQTAIADTVSWLESIGISPHLHRLGTFNGFAHRESMLTSRQREILEQAHDMGYFEIPRGVTVADIAAELDIDASTVNEHLQRAERNLLQDLFIDT